MKIVVAVTGASGVNIAIKFINKMPKNIQLFVIVSKSAKLALKHESKIKFQNKNNITYYNNNSIDACISSGSFKVDKMIIIPCSMNTLAKCTIGISDTLITRVFSVMLKEKRKIILSPREMPYNTIQLENMTKLSFLGVVIAPPVLGYYSSQKTLEDMENFIIGKWLDLLDINNELYDRWNGGR